MLIQESQAAHGGVRLLLFQVVSSGVISTVAGGGPQITAAPATAAILLNTYSVAIGANGDVHISDSAHTVRKVVAFASFLLHVVHGNILSHDF